MNNSEQPVYPSLELDFTESAIQSRTVFQGQYYGLTKREHIATEAMKAILSNPSLVSTHGEYERKWVANHALYQADELLKKLEDERLKN